MIISISYLGLGTVLLYFGANWIVRSGVHIAGKFNISPLVVGLTVVAFGTSLPELVISLKAALADSSTIAVGNVIGSNIANVGLVLGLSSLIFPLTVRFKSIRRDLFIYIGVCCLFIIFTYDGIITRVEGLILFIGIISYTVMCIRRPTSEIDTPRKHYRSTLFAISAFIAGMITLYFGADFFVSGAIRMAHLLGVDEIVIGMSVVAFGTSLPELATSVVAALRKESAISIGNIIGSNLFNILSVIGLVAFIVPLESPTEIMYLEIPFMVAFGLVMFPIAMMKQPIPRLSSFLLLSGYITFILLLFSK